MNETSGPVYEVTFDVDGECVEQFDNWLNNYLDAIKDSPGVREAGVFEREDVHDRDSRVLRVRFAGDPELQNFVTGPAEPNRQLQTSGLAVGVTTSVRVLRRSALSGVGRPPAKTCLNCGSTLAGQYCGNCGQRAASRLISLTELLKDAFGELFELDSRLWRTLITLSIRPGELTRDYLRGRRVRYMPPFRMYLVMSIVFFVIAFFDPQEEFGLLFEPPAEPAPEAGATGQAGDDAADPGGADRDGDPQSVRFTMGDEFEAECQLDGLEDDDIPPWLASRLTPERIKIMCNRLIADDGRAFLDKLLDNVPVALFILLPVMAFVMQVLYPLSRRYYVEHLLFIVHYHTFVFLVLSIQALFSRLGGLAMMPELPFDILGLALALYVPVYLLLAQRRVYEQGRIVTVVKFAILAFAYLIGLLFMFGMVAILAALSI